MILCDDTSVLAMKREVQKDVDLEDLLNNHTRYFETQEQALEEGYVPLDFSMTLRSMYTNKVLQRQTENGVRYYVNMSKVDRFIHKGIDLIMYLTSLGLLQCVDYKAGFDDLMFQHTQIQIIGLYNPDPAMINPIIYSHVLISDVGVESLPQYLKEGVSLVDIKTMKENCEGNIPAMLDTIIEVKEEQKDE